MLRTREKNPAGQGDEGPFWGEGKILYLDYGGADMGAKNQLFKVYEFTVCKKHLNKAD